MQQVLQGLRPYVSGDLEELAALLGAAGAWPPPVAPTPKDILNRWRHWDLNPEQDINVLPGPDGTIIAFSQSALSRRDTRRVSLEIAVHPDYQRRGIGSALYDLIEVRAHELAASHITSPVYMSPQFDKSAPIKFLLDRGFRCTSSYWRLRIDRLGHLAPAKWPSGINYRVFKNNEHDASKWARLIQVAFAEPASADMVRAQVSEVGSSPDGYFFAIDTETGIEVGTSRARLESVGGEDLGYIGTVGVLPEYRGRRIAEALVRQTLAYIASQGRDSATLFVEENNKPARALYEKMGWYPVYRTDHYWKALQVLHPAEMHA